MSVTAGNIGQAYEAVLRRLRRLRQPDGWWEGELSPSALGTATAVSALAVLGQPGDAALVSGGVRWLAADQNEDGGWGDTPESPSNLSTTLLCLAAFKLAGAGGASATTAAGGLDEDEVAHVLMAADEYVMVRAGRTAAERAAAVTRLYGEDRTFAVPILINMALCGLVDWGEIPRLPFEFSIFPHGVLRLLRAEVVSYALPALIGIGLLLHRKRPTRFLPLRWLRSAIVGPALRRLHRLQPTTGGFIEAVPLTAFVVMSLVAAGRGDSAVALKGAEFLRRSVRPEGCWPIDSNLSVWVTSQASRALATAALLSSADCDGESRARGAEELSAEVGPTWRWILERQHESVHPFTASRPGGWGWTHLSGGVPDADDTSAALLAMADALAAGAGDAGRIVASGAAGVRWLLGLQNGDGGWPTFCRGWGRLPFDRSGCDLTAHALRALHAWRAHLPQLRPAIDRATACGLEYLRAHQREDGSWLPLWFGNQQAADQVNATIGTSRVLAAYGDLDRHDDEAARRGLSWLLAAQGSDGGWGAGDGAAGAGVAATIEETALALEAICGFEGEVVAAAADRAADWLCGRVESGEIDNAAPIGLYFTGLWYWERLYPVVWSAGALGRYLRRGRGLKD